MYLDNGFDLENSIYSIESENIIQYLIGDKEYKNEEELLGKWLVYESDFFEDLLDKYKRHIDFELFSKEYGQDMIAHIFKNGKVYSLLAT